MASSDRWMSSAPQLMKTEVIETEEEAALRHKLGLYQVFSRLYEHRRDLLDEILSLETSSSVLANVKLPYIQGTMLNEPHLVTNLIDGKTQALLQPQFRWVIGRNPLQATIALADRRLSRTHAVIEYVAKQGFYLTDLGSRHGTFVNGEPVRQPVLLQDGDRICLSSVRFVFFLCDSVQVFASGLPASGCSSSITYSPFSITASGEFHPDSPCLEPDQAPPCGTEEETLTLMR